ncbi:MAG: DUF4428 domain-containing protein [Lachnospiraceae bacterium]|nr:DUF4428 domain-containing protein [Lachnospiraceae bacterium]
MGFFSNLFGKKNCCLCGAECGMTKRTGIKNKEYVCSDCATKCSEHVRLSELDKAGVETHIIQMERQEKLFEKYFENTKKKIYPTAFEVQQIIFMDEIGMFTIRTRNNPKRKVNHDMFRYDTVKSYDYYCKKEKDQNGKEIFKEDGIVIKFNQPMEVNDQDVKAGKRSHPYVKRDVTVVFRKNEKTDDYANIALGHFDAIFGVDRDRTAMFGGASAQKKAEIKAGAQMLEAFATVAKATAKGELEEAANDPNVQAKLQGAMDSAADAATRGLSKYSQAADEAEASLDNN